MKQLCSHPHDTKGLMRAFKKDASSVPVIPSQDPVASRAVFHAVDGTNVQQALFPYPDTVVFLFPFKQMIIPG